MSIIACEKIPIFDRINDNIFLGDIVGASDSNLIKKVDIIISLIDIQIRYNNIEYFIFPLDDSRDVQINILFTKTNEIIENSIKKIKKF